MIYIKYLDLRILRVPGTRGTRSNVAPDPFSSRPSHTAASHHVNNVGCIINMLRGTDKMGPDKMYPL